MAGPCVADTACIELTVSPTGALQAAPIISPDVENAFECRANGMYVPRALQGMACGSVGEANLFALISGYSTTGIQAGSLALVNPSATRVMVVYAQVGFGTADIFCAPGADCLITYRVGFNNPIVDAGYIFHQNTGAVNDRSATAPSTYSAISCPTPIAAGATYTLSWDAKVDIGTGLTSITMRPVFAQLWGVVT